MPVPTQKAKIEDVRTYDKALFRELIHEIKEMKTTGALTIHYANGSMAALELRTAKRVSVDGVSRSV